MSQSNTFTRPQAFAALRAIVHSLSSAWDLDTTLDLIARKTTEVMHVDSCTIYLLDPDSDALRLQASTGLAKRALGRSTLRVGEGMTGHAVAHNKPIFAANARENPHFKWVEEAEETGRDNAGPSSTLR
jgi:signal transduction protein with GAF and PtsI domain